MNYLDKLQKKCKLNQEFIDKTNFLIDKLVEFGYIDNINVPGIYKKLYNNINAVFIGSDNPYDYKTGYYDSIKKELYIKDIKDVKSLFLRLIYAITTSPKNEDTYNVGYSKTSMSKLNYKQEHIYFGLNRAVASNLVCRLIYAEPTALSIIPSYKKYTCNFFGHEIITDNNIYFLEGVILKQICFALGLEEEEFYSHLFFRPNVYLNKVLKKVKIDYPEKLLKLLDEASLKYSNYNKLQHLDNLLKDNYLELKRIDLDEREIDNLQKQKNEINYQISKKIYEIRPELEDEEDYDAVANLNETLNMLENDIIKSISTIQDILVDTLIKSKDEYSPAMFVAKQKQLQKLLIFKSEKLEESIFETISYRILNTFESSSSNLIEKIKYSIASEILSSEKYIKTYNNMEFNKLLKINTDEYEQIVVLSINGKFMQLLKISNLNLDFKDLKDNVEVLKMDNLRFLLNTGLSAKATQNIERVYTYLRNNIDEYKNINMDSFFITNINDISVVIVTKDNSFDVLKMDIFNDNVSCSKIPISETYQIFNISNSSYNNKIYKTQNEEKE